MMNNTIHKWNLPGALYSCYIIMVTDGLEQTTDMMAASAGSAYVFRLPIIILRNIIIIMSKYIIYVPHIISIRICTNSTEKNILCNQHDINSTGLYMNALSISLLVLGLNSKAKLKVFTMFCRAVVFNGELLATY